MAELVIITSLLMIIKFSCYPVYRIILHKIPNFYFEFISFVIPQTSRGIHSLLMQFCQQFLLAVLFALVAFYLLGINACFAFALLFGLFSLIPYLGLFLAGIFTILLLPPSENLIFQIVGIIISIAVIWLVRFILFSNKSKLVLPVLEILALVIVGFVFYSLIELYILLLIPMFLMALLLLQFIAHAAPLLHHPNNLLRKILLT